jgi:hypothetical protein
VLSVSEDDGAAGIPEQLVDLESVEGCVQRHGGGPGGHDAQVSSHPERPVTGHNGATHAFRHPRFPQPPAHGLTHTPQLGIGKSLHRARRALQLDRGMGRVLLYGFEKTTVKTVHSDFSLGEGSLG